MTIEGKSGWIIICTYPPPSPNDCLRLGDVGEGVTMVWMWAERGTKRNGSDDRVIGIYGVATEEMGIVMRD